MPIACPSRIISQPMLPVPSTPSRLPCKRDQVLARPAALLDLRGHPGQPPGGGEQQGQGVFGHDRRGAAGHVGDDDAQLAGRGQVDAVVADRGSRRSAAAWATAAARSPASAPLRGSSGSPWQPARAADLLLVALWSSVVEHHLGALAQPLQVRRAGDHRRPITGNHDQGSLRLHAWAILSRRVRIRGHELYTNSLRVLTRSGRTDPIPSAARAFSGAAAPENE